VKKFRSPILDLLRIFAAFWVLLFHWTGSGGFYFSLVDKFNLSWWPEWVIFIAKPGYLGVDIFFILSGAVIAKSALRTDPRKFAVSRFLRIWPVYFLVTAGALLVNHFAAHGSTLVNDFVALTGLQFWLGGPTPVGPAWTLKPEINFYFLIYLCLFYCSWRKSKMSEPALFRFLFFWVIILTVSIYMPFSAFSFLYLPKFGPYFILGAALSQVKNRSTAFKYFFICMISFVLVEKQILIRTGQQFHNNKYLFSITLLIIVSILVVMSNFTPQEWKVNQLRNQIETLSLMTYPIYLFHDSIGVGLISLLSHGGIDIRFVYVVVFFLTMLFSWWSVKIYEPRFKRIFIKLVGG
jgi:peptidoglycan/LPS O-acetylase OafA/YrhL